MDSFRKVQSSDVFTAVRRNLGLAVSEPKVDVTV